jgi:hypothetical protein
VVPSTARPEIDDAQPQADVGYSSTFINDEQYHVSQTSQSPSAAAKAIPVAEYQEWSFQGFFKHSRIRDDVTYNLEFKLPSISEHFQRPLEKSCKLEFLDFEHPKGAHD